MSIRKVNAFFYGLFMDIDLLRESGVTPENPRRAHVAEFALRIGQRATLVPSPESRAYGMVIELTYLELKRLYEAPGLEEYAPEAVLVETSEGIAIPALCFNLLQVPEPNERNPDYALRLQRVLEKLGFPDRYIESLG